MTKTLCKYIKMKLLWTKMKRRLWKQSREKKNPEHNNGKLLIYPSETVKTTLATELEHENNISVHWTLYTQWKQSQAMNTKVFHLRILEEICISRNTKKFSMLQSLQRETLWSEKQVPSYKRLVKLCLRENHSTGIQACHA